jgi:SAM-dependent methyltransferase
MAAMAAAECAWCGGGAWSAEVTRAREMMFGTQVPYELAPCGSCGSLALLDPPADPSKAYPEDYYSLKSEENRQFGSAAGVALKAGAEVLLRSPAAVLDPLIARAPYSAWCFRWFAGRGVRKADAILDVGSGDGFLLRALATYGFRRLAGVDPYLTEELVEGPIELRRAELGETEGTRRVIMFHHVLEHVPDPVAQLERARERLQPGGTVIVRVPLSDSWAARQYGGDWVQLDVPRHLTVPTAAGVARAAERAGLSVVRSFRDSSAFQFWASEQYRRDIPMQGDRSWLTDRERSPITAEQVAEWESRARTLNRKGAGDQGCFVLAAATG